MITVACVKYGNKYGASHVNKLQEMVSEHLTVPHEFVCLTDNPQDVKCKTLPFTSKNVEGWWSKMNLFDQDDFNEWILYFDLDVIIHNNIDDLVDTRFSFNSIRDFHYPEVFNSSVMFWERDRHKELWAVYNDDAQHYKQTFKGDQDLITELIKSGNNWCTYPDVWTWSWKWGDIRTNASANEKVFHLSNEAKVAVFHGRPNPWEITTHDFDYVIKYLRKP